MAGLLNSFPVNLKLNCMILEKYKTFASFKFFLPCFLFFSNFCSNGESGGSGGLFAHFNESIPMPPSGPFPEIEVPNVF